MYRVLIVDDEPFIRNGIEAFIDWEKERMSVEAVCTNGVVALTALEKSPGDILITDIRMPVINGIQLTKQALESYPWLKVILISSYDDFEYVREGLKLGAVDYLLKAALKPEELLTVLRRCISMLEEERRKEAEFQQGAVYRERKNIEQEIKRLIVQEQASLPSTGWSPVWLKQRYSCVYLMLDGAEELRENYGCLHLQLMLEDLQELFYKQVDVGAAMLMGESGLFLVVPDCMGDAKLRLRQWKQFVETELGVSLSAGLSVEQGISGILKGLSASRTACRRRFFEGLGGIYEFEESAENKGTMMVSADEETPPDWKALFDMIRKGDPASSTVEYAVERWRGLCQEPEQIKQEAFRLLTEINGMQAETGAMFLELLDLLERTETLDQIVSILKRGLEEIGKTFIPKLADNGNGAQLVMKALEYIAGHYTENLTLQSVADSVHLSRTYFSQLFKKQTGQTFIDYLMELRIREAKRLLAEEDGRIYDIAETAGFNDVKYFSKLFKKMTGFTPLEFREKYRSTGSHIAAEIIPNPI